MEASGSASRARAGRLTRWSSPIGGFTLPSRDRDVPGEELFQYLDDDGARQTIGSGDVNDYLREISGQEFTAKDFRTWAGTMLAVRALRDLGPMDTEREAKSAIVRAVDQVAEQLNNTRAVCRKYYIHPTVLETYLAGTMVSGLGNGTRVAAAAATGSALNAEEKALVRLLNGTN